MRDKTVERWQQRIQRAAALLGSKLDEPPSLRELAEAAAISPYHFHRVWRAMTGRTVGEMIRHLRIKEASRVLIESNTSVTEVAQLVGFASSQSFARAFRQELGVSPSSLAGRAARNGDLKRSRLRGEFRDLNAYFIVEGGLRHLHLRFRLGGATGDFRPAGIGNGILSLHITRYVAIR
jgi:AraC-like DNA-binding protein